VKERTDQEQEIKLSVKYGKEGKHTKDDDKIISVQRKASSLAS
jgi:hypothetical protein